MKSIFNLTLFSLIAFQTSIGFAQQLVQDDYERFYIEGGIQIPIGNLKSKINAAPNFGFWFKTNIKKDESVDFGCNLSIQNSNHNFVFEKNDSIFRNVPKGASGMVGLRYSKVFLLSEKKNISAEWFPSFGYGFLMLRSNLIGLSNGRESSPKQSSIALSTLHFGQGLRFNIDNIGIQAQYHFTPYHLFYNYIDKDFGSHSLVFGIVYRQ